MSALRRICVALLVASLGGLSAVAVSACGEEEDREQVGLSLTERDLSPDRVEVKPGEIEFVVRNDGRRLHAFAVETPDGIERTDDIKPGETARLTVDLPEGKYRVYDPREDYRARGVRGTVIVTSGDTGTVTERTVTERTVEEDTVEEPPVEEPPVTVTQTERQPPPPRQPAPPPVTREVPPPPPPTTPTSP